MSNASCSASERSLCVYAAPFSIRRAGPKRCCANSFDAKIRGSIPFTPSGDWASAGAVTRSESRASTAFIPFSLESVLEIVEVFAAGDGDRHGTGYAGQLFGAGSGDDGYTERKGAAVHRAAVLQGEGSAAPGESPADSLDGDITRGSARGVAGGQHLAFAGSFEVTVELLVEGHP